MKPIIGITIGDINGIGPEVVLKSLKDKSILDICTPLLIGPIILWEKIANDFNLKFHFLPFRSISDLSKKYINVFDLLFEMKTSYGKIDSDSGFLSAQAIFSGYHICNSGIADALVTAPICKEALQKAGFLYQGHTEMLAKFSNTKLFCMMLIANKFRVALQTTHIPLKEVSNQLTQKKIIEKISILDLSLKHDFSIKKPRIAVLALNPHAGDGGVLGTEEDFFIIPAIKKSRAKGYLVDGPFAADGFFSTHNPADYDAILAMYHDQGLIPLKMASKGTGINYTAGLNIIRTSPDHGTAFNIAGKGLAKPESMKEAIRFAVNLAKLRKK